MEEDSKRRIVVKRKRSYCYPSLKYVPNELVASVTRAGIIPVVVQRSSSATAECKVYFALGLDSIHSELTDCGGFIKGNETIMKTAVRELYEESVHIFDFRSKYWNYMIYNFAPIITNGIVCIFFVKIYNNRWYGFPYRLPYNFRYNQHLATRWIRSKHIKPLIENYTMYWIPLDELDQISKIKNKQRGIVVVNGLYIPIFINYGTYHPYMYEVVRRVLGYNKVLHQMKDHLLFPHHS